MRVSIDGKFILRSLVLYIVWFGFFQFSFSQDTWVKTYQPFGDGDYYVEDVLVCQDGGYAVNGYYYCYDPEPGTGCNDYWGFLMKTDQDGNLDWVKMDTVNWIFESESSAFVQTDDGGFLSSVYSLWGGTALIKRDSLGNREWVVDNGGIQDGLYVHSMDKTLDGNIILGGRKNGQSTIRKITITGETLWTHSYFPQSGSIQSIIQTSDGGYAGTGYINLISMDILVIRTDENGDSLWTLTMDGYSDYDGGANLIENNFSNLILSGSFGLDNGFNSVFAEITMNADTLWTIQFESSSGIGGKSIIEIDDGYILFGHLLSKLNHSLEIEWSNSLPGYLPGGDRSIQKVNDGYIFTRNNIGNGFYNFIGLVKSDPFGNMLSVTNEFHSILEQIEIRAYPNPFNPTTMIRYELTRRSNVEITIYDLQGRQVTTLLSETQEAGLQSVQWNATNVPSGMYFYQIRAGVYVQTRKMVLLK